MACIEARADSQSIIIANTKLLIVLIAECCIDAKCCQKEKQKQKKNCEDG